MWTGGIHIYMYIWMCITESVGETLKGTRIHSDCRGERRKGVKGSKAPSGVAPFDSVRTWSYFVQPPSWRQSPIKPPTTPLRVDANV